ncbi:hypothetical protein BIW11_09063, partial [Tropilaelaps mercedesae]
KSKRAKENQSQIKNIKRAQKDTKRTTKKSRSPLRLKDLTPARKQTPLHTTFSLAFRMAVRRLRAEGKLPSNALDEPVDTDGVYLAANTEGHTYLIRQLRYKVHRECPPIEQEGVEPTPGPELLAPKTNHDATSVTLPTITTTTCTTPMQVSGISFDVINLEGTTPLTQADNSVSE